jgi:hypothetical protein
VVRDAPTNLAAIPILAKAMLRGSFSKGIDLPAYDAGPA